MNTMNNMNNSMMNVNNNMNNITNINNDFLTSKKYYKEKLNSYYLNKIPNNELDLKLIVVDLFKNDLIPLPIDSLHIYRIIKKKCKIFENSVYLLSRLDINQVIISLINEGCFLYEDIIISNRKCFYIKDINYKQLNVYANSLQGLEQSEALEEDQMKFVIMETLNSKKEKENIVKNRLLKESKIKPYSSNYFFYQPNNYEVLNYNMNLNYYHKGKLSKYNIDSLLGEDNNKKKQSKVSTNNNVINDLEQDEQDIMNSIFYQPSAKMLLSNQLNNQETKNEENLTLSNLNQKYKSSTIKPFCTYGTRADCVKKSKKGSSRCEFLHFKPIIRPHTEVSLGDCSYLDTCRHMDICKFVHYELEDITENDNITTNRRELVLSSLSGSLPSQWINCDIRYFDLNILGNFEVIMADPPWDIHMDLPYGTLTDEEMKGIKVQNLQTDGVIFLWVTGRATELARECLDLWGYERKEELVWIKTNQLQRLIRTGRTGHWLNHSKEHCLVGFKGNPKLNRNLDCDVLVSEVRETSRKPDEVYELIERLCSGGRKIELFARPHNRRHGWVSLGNQLPGAYIVEDDVIDRFNTAYPNEKLTKEDMENNRLKSIETKKKAENE